MGVSSAKRSPAAPDIPAIGETVSGFGAELWVAVFAPAGTPDDVTRAIEALLAKAVSDTELQAKLAGNGAELAKPTYGKALAKVLREDVSKWDVMVKASGAKVD